MPPCLNFNVSSELVRKNSEDITNARTRLLKALRIKFAGGFPIIFVTAHGKIKSGSTKLVHPKRKNIIPERYAPNMRIKLWGGELEREL